MNLFARCVCLSGFVLTAFLFLISHPALAGEYDCIQNRATAPAPPDIYDKANPLKATANNLSAGRMLYMGGAKPFGCYPCHGINGNGLGMTATKMILKPRDFSCKEMMKDIPDGQLFWIIQNGSEGTEMNAYKALNDEQVWQIVAYIREFSK